MSRAGQDGAGVTYEEGRVLLSPSDAHFTVANVRSVERVLRVHRLFAGLHASHTTHRHVRSHQTTRRAEQRPPPPPKRAAYLHLNEAVTEIVAGHFIALHITRDHFAVL
jgi:hypothetical protein